MLIKSLKTRLLAMLLLVVSPAVLMAAPDGKALYVANCAACHGVDGRGGVGVPLALPEFLDSVNDNYLFNTIRLGRPGRVMPAFNNLSDIQVKAIVEHVRNFSPKSKRPVDSMAFVRGDIKKGKALYQKYCASCHGANGEGGMGTGVTFSRPRDLPVIAPAINNSGFLAAATDSMIKSTLMNGREGTPMPSFIKLGLKEQDINDIVSYVRSFEKTVQKKDNSVDKEPSVVVVESPYSYEKTLANVKAAAKAANYRIIRVQAFDSGLVDKKHENSKRTIVYFCNFQLLNEVLAVDPRVGLFLPCRVTIVEEEGKVKIMAINPRRLAALYNNNELDKACDEMYRIYQEILEEATL